VSLVPAVVLLKELPPAGALAGIVLILVGSYAVADKENGTPGSSVFHRFFSDRGVQYRLAALVLSATEAVFLKRALMASSPLMTFAVWATAGFAISLMCALVFGRTGFSGQARILSTNWIACLLLAGTTGLMQLTTLVVLTEFQVAAALALFQTSTLLTVLLGWRVFGEQNFVKRFLGCLVMVVGAMLIVVSR
jgi:drug/metabolite transporter (DMT)-like permease